MKRSRRPAPTPVFDVEVKVTYTDGREPEIITYRNIRAGSVNEAELKALDSADFVVELGNVQDLKVVCVTDYNVLSKFFPGR